MRSILDCNGIRAIKAIFLGSEHSMFATRMKITIILITKMTSSMLVGCEDENPTGDDGGGGGNAVDGADRADDNYNASSSSSSSGKGKEVVLGPSLNGSPRYLNDLALNALEITTCLLRRSSIIQ